MQFGLYLVRNGVITADQFVAALEARLESTVPLHQLAIEEGAMSVHDVLEVLRAQSQSPEESFTDTARRLDRLTDETYNRLRINQADRERPLADILVKLNVLTAQRAHELWQAYRQAQQQRGPHHREQIPRLRVLRHRVPALPTSPISKVPKPIALHGTRRSDSPADIAGPR